MFHFEIRKNGTAFELLLLRSDSTVRWGELVAGECSLVVIKGWTNEYTKHSEIEIFLLKVALYLSFSEIWSIFRQTDILTFPLLQSVSISLTRMGD